MPERKKNSHDRRGRKSTKKAVSSDDMRHKLEITKACELRARGWNYKEIAGHLKCCIKHVHDLLVMGLKNINEKHDTTVGQYREQEWEATQLLFETYLPLALQGDGQAFDRVMRLLERRAKYRGLDVVNQGNGTAIASGALNLNVETVNVGFIPKDQLKDLLMSKIAEHQSAKDRAAAIEYRPQNETATKTATELDDEPPNEGTD